LDRAFKQQATEQQDHCRKQRKWDVNELDEHPPKGGNRDKPSGKECEQGDDCGHSMTINPSLSLKAIGTGHVV
jgi:hypothetical protein